MKATPHKLVCGVCGFLYDPAENGNLTLADMPNGYWCCPECGAEAAHFHPECNPDEGP